MYLNFHGGGKFKNVTKTKGIVEIPHVALNFIGCVHPETMMRFLNMDDKNHDGLLERYALFLINRFICTCFDYECVSLDEIRQNQFDSRILEGFFCF